MAVKIFPIMTVTYRDRDKNTDGAVRAAGGCFVIVGLPWDMIAPHAAQAYKNHSQSLERLAERGGLSAFEAIATLDGKGLWDFNLPQGEANAVLASKINNWLAAIPSQTQPAAVPAAS